MCVSNKIKQEMTKIEIPKELSSRSLMGVNQAKGKFLFFIFLFILIPFSFYVYANIYDNYISWNNGYSTILAILIYLIVFIPLMAYLSEKLAKFSLKLGLDKRKNFIIFIAILITIPIIVTINDYREKDLDDVISFNSKNFEQLILGNAWTTDKKEHADELIDFLSQYRIKKMKDDEWNGDVSKEKGFSIDIYLKDKSLGASIYENRVWVYRSGKSYHVVNGPIDIDWIEKKVQEEFDELQW